MRARARVVSIVVTDSPAVPEGFEAQMLLRVLHQAFKLSRCYLLVCQFEISVHHDVSAFRSG